MKKSSVIDVAQACGVSPSTVCRALNEKSDINPDTRTRILDACRTLGYVRNVAASNLRKKQTTLITCLMPDNDNELFVDKLHFLKTGVLTAGFTWRVFSYRDNNERRLFLDEILGAGPAGLILCAALEPEDRHALQSNRIATVCYDRADDLLDCVTLDRETGCREATTHLLNSGRRRILLLGSTIAEVRGLGYQRAHQEAGLSIDPTLINGTRFGRDLYSYGWEQTNHFLKETNFDAILAVNDACAIGAIRALHEAGRSVPRDIAVIGFDNIRVSRFLQPSLTTVAQPIEEMASHALSCLFARMRDFDRPRAHINLMTTLIRRESA